MGYNFIPRKEDGSNVIRDENGVVIKILANWEGIEVPWVRDGEKMVVAKEALGSLSDIKPILGDMRKHVNGVFRGSKGKKKKTKKSKKNLRPVSWAFLSEADRTRLEILSINGIKYLTGGWIEIRQRIKVGDDLITITPKIVKDIDAAIRMQGKHILPGYKGRGKQKGEIAKLHAMEEIIRKANDLYAHWVKIDSQRPDIIQKKLAHILTQMIDCHNENKFASADNIAEAMPIEDRLGRVNPGAKAAITVAALNRLDDRFNQLRRIMPIIALRQELLVFEKNWMEIQIKQTCLYLKSILRRPQNHFYSRINDIDGKIGRVIYTLDTLFPSPFFEKAQKCKAYLLEAKKFIRSNNAPISKRIINSAIKILDDNYRLMSSTQ